MKHFLTGAWLMFRTHLVALVVSRRALLCLALAAAVPALAWFPAESEHALQVVAGIGTFLLLMVVAPLVGLIFGSTVVTEEVENRTITYVFTRPVPRAALFVGRWLATLVVTSVLLGASAVAVTEVASAPRAGDATAHREWDRRSREVSRGPVDRSLPEGIGGRAAIAAALAGALYSLLTGALGVFVKRPMIFGLGYAFAVEGLLANIPISTQRLSMQYYLRGILADLGEPPHPGFWAEIPMFERTEFLPPEACGVRLAIVLVVALLFASWAITRRQFVLSS